MPEQTIYITIASGKLNSAQKAKLAELGVTITVSSHDSSCRGQYSGDLLDDIRALDFIASVKDEKSVRAKSERAGLINLNGFNGNPLNVSTLGPR